MLEFKDSTHVWGRRGAMWLELRGKNWPRASLFSLFFLFYCTAYSRAELGGVCESRSVVETHSGERSHFQVSNIQSLFSRAGRGRGLAGSWTS